MTNTSPNLLLPYLMPAQAQKHVTHNEALQRLDILVQLRVQAFDAVQPPAVPEEGTVFALGSGVTGDWVGQEDTLAAYTNGGWQYFTPGEGWRATLDHASDIKLLQNAGQLVGVSKIPLDQMIPETGIAVPRREIVIDNCSISRLLQGQRRVGTDIASATYNKDISTHLYPLSKGAFRPGTDGILHAMTQVGPALYQSR